MKKKNRHQDLSEPEEKNEEEKEEFFTMKENKLAIKCNSDKDKTEKNFDVETMDAKEIDEFTQKVNVNELNIERVKEKENKEGLTSNYREEDEEEILCNAEETDEDDSLGLTYNEMIPLAIDGGGN